MDRIRQDDLRQLMTYQGPWCVSLFMSTHRAGPETRQDPIRYKNLLRLAEHAMARRGIVNGTRKNYLAKAQQLLTNSRFWQHQSDGLAVFVGPDHFSTWTLPNHFAENVIVDERFQVKPLLPVYFGDSRFYLLSLSQKRVRVHVCNRDEHTEIQVVGVPTSIEEYMQVIEPTGGIHQGRLRAPGAGGADVHGSGTENVKQRIVEFFRQIDTGLHDLLKDETAPLLVACVDSLYPLYREANSYPRLLQAHLTGNPEGPSPHDLHARAWELLAPQFSEKQASAVRQFNQMDGTRKASRHIKSIVPAAVNGRVELLLVAADQELWGTFDPATSQAKETRKPGPNAQELLNLAAVHTLLTGGSVYVMPSMDMPEGVPMAAIFRY
jgi:hypothetical protein